MIYAYRELKILLLVSYYNRPLLVRDALKSVLVAGKKHKNWVMAFGDDGSEIPGEPVVREVMADKIRKVTFYNTHDDIDTKIERGIGIGRLANDVLSKTDADVVVTLCDDDRLHPDYLWKLNNYFLKNRNVMYCYSNIYLFNPFTDKPEDVTVLAGGYNAHKGPIDCYGKVDGSQVAFRTCCIRDNNIWYRDSTKSQKPENTHIPWQYNLDGELFKAFSDKIGQAQYTGFVSQYKGVHKYQMVYHKEHKFHKIDDIRVFHRDVTQKAGKEF